MAFDSPYNIDWGQFIYDNYDNMMAYNQYPSNTSLMVQNWCNDINFMANRNYAIPVSNSYKDSIVLNKTNNSTASNNIIRTQENTKNSGSKKCGIVIGVTLLLTAASIWGLYKHGGIKAKNGKEALESVKEGWNKIFKKSANKQATTEAAVATEAVKGADIPKTDTAKKTEEIVEKKKSEICEQIKELKQEEAREIKSYTTLDEAISDYKQKLSTGNYDYADDTEKMLKTLQEHNYREDNSIIQIYTRTKDCDYGHAHSIDISNSKEYMDQYIIRGSYNDANRIKLPDGIGDYIIRTLPTGQKIVSISIPTGRVDFSRRPIREMLTIVSKGNEFTTIQKDLIDIISQRKNILNQCSTNADILSLGVLTNIHATPHNREIMPYEINKDILLSSISTAKKQLKPQDIDKDFVEKALNGDQLEHINY